MEFEVFIGIGLYLRHWCNQCVCVGTEETRKHWLNTCSQ